MSSKDPCRKRQGSLLLLEILENPLDEEKHWIAIEALTEFYKERLLNLFLWSVLPVFLFSGTGWESWLFSPVLGNGQDNFPCGFFPEECFFTIRSPRN